MFLNFSTTALRGEVSASPFHIWGNQGFSKTTYPVNGKAGVPTEYLITSQISSSQGHRMPLSSAISSMRTSGPELSDLWCPFKFSDSHLIAVPLLIEMRLGAGPVGSGLSWETCLLRNLCWMVDQCPALALNLRTLIPWVYLTLWGGLNLIKGGEWNQGRAPQTPLRGWKMEWY